MCHGHTEIGWQGWEGQKFKFPEPSPGPSSLYEVVIPELHRSIGLLEWKLVEDVAQSGMAPSILFPPQTLPDCHYYCLRS